MSLSLVAWCLIPEVLNVLCLLPGDSASPLASLCLSVYGFIVSSSLLDTHMCLHSIYNILIQIFHIVVQYYHCYFFTVVLYIQHLYIYCTIASMIYLFSLNDDLLLNIQYL